MSIDLTPTDFVLDAPVTTITSPSREEHLEQCFNALGEALEADFAAVDVEADVVVREAGGLSGDWLEWRDLCREVSHRGSSEIIAEEQPLVLLAVPLPQQVGAVVALGVFPIELPLEPGDVEAALARMGLSAEDGGGALRCQQVWPPRGLARMATLAIEKLAADWQLGLAEQENEQVSSHLLGTYEEISLLHRLAQNLKISRHDSQLAKMALNWLSAVVPAECLLLNLKASTDDPTLSKDSPSKWIFLTEGECPIEQPDFEHFVECLGREAKYIPIVLNRQVTGKSTWPYRQVREVISVPLVEGGKSFGWLMAINHSEEREFGTVEASLLGSVGAILAIHFGNTELYRQQAEFLAGVVRALTAAIDAKDPYTCGHSDRVARVSVRLGEELGCDRKTLHTIYLSGLLHDIGKIGINDNILRKPGRLTHAEFEHVKLHPELGYKILRDIKQLDQILPVVLHHHEAWNGNGYPHGLAGEAIPFLARIVAVADSFDAMSSDRPYRKGMSQEKLEQILKDGAGGQWDPNVVAAFMQARDDILAIARRERDNLQLDFQLWT